MSRILVLYGTTDGHTALIAGAVARALREQECIVSIADAAGVSLPEARDFDAVIVAASVHAGGYQRPVLRWLQANDAALDRRPTAFLSVCLGVLEHKPDVDRQLDTVIHRFLAQARWQPGRVRKVAGALPYTKYGWLKKRMMRRISAKAGGDTDITRDYVYTDWDDLRVFAGAFVRDHGLAPEARVPIGL